MTIPVDHIAIELTAAELERQRERAELQQMAADLRDCAQLDLGTLATTIAAELTDDEIRHIAADAICALVSRVEFTFVNGTVRWWSLKPAEAKVRELHQTLVPSYWHDEG